jgi:hypothetical protein
MLFDYISVLSSSIIRDLNNMKKKSNNDANYHSCWVVGDDQIL